MILMNKNKELIKKTVQIKNKQLKHLWKINKQNFKRKILKN